MSLASTAIEQRAVSYFVVVLITVAGIGSFFGLGQLEDPEFSIKTAVILTQYPGASPEEVELEVTDRIELALQELPQLDYVESWSRAGESLVSVEIKPEYWADRLPQVWDELRRKIRDVQPQLPPGTYAPIISDDFGDVFGFQLAVAGDGYSYAELDDFAKELRRELSVIEGVARVDLWGVQQEVIYVETTQARLSELGLSTGSVVNTLTNQNLVVDAGSVDVQRKRLRIAPTGAFASPEDIGELTIRQSVTDRLQSRGSEASAGELLALKDIATIRRGYAEPPFTQLRYNGLPAIGISITNLAGVNVVTVGRAIDARLLELLPLLPVGIEVRQVHWMSDDVAEAVTGFLVSFAQAVAIVLALLAVFMGWRMGLIIGSALILTILGTFILMSIMGIDLQRMSLGALIIALGMMVDNAIVVADGFAVRLQSGIERRKAAIEAASLPAGPLLGATLIAVMAFYPIFASVDSAGEYCRTLFSVVGIALLVSWVISVTVTPLMCMDLLPDPASADGGSDPYNTAFYMRFRGLLNTCIRNRMLTIGVAAGVLVVSFIAFGSVTQLFFPDSSMDKFMIDVFDPEGTRIQDVYEHSKSLEALLLEDERVDSVAAYVGSGPPRFYLPVAPESPQQGYAQLIVNVRDFREIDELIADVKPKVADKLPDALVSIRKYGVGPDQTWTFEYRISGPAVADPGILRSLSGRVLKVLAANPLTGTFRTDWRNRVPKLRAEYSQDRGRWAAVSREDVANATKRAFDGLAIGLYREADDLIPIVFRHAAEERARVGSMETIQIRPRMSINTVPMSQVVDGIDVAWEDPIIGRRDRRRTVTVQANPIQGVTLPTLLAEVRAEIEAIELPPGYRGEWGGEYEDTVDAQAGLLPGVLPSVAVILVIIVGLFNAFKPPIVILLTIPFVWIGITVGLLLFNVPFGFVAMLGAMSLAGMMIKNAIVLLDQVNVNLADGRSQYDAVVEAAVSRLRPVVLAAATTVLGVVPLLQDVFWIGMAVTLMAGLSFGTVLTMVLVPVLYAIIFRIPEPDRSARLEGATGAAASASG